MDGLAFIAAVVALFVAFGMRRKLAALQAQLATLTDELRSLRTQVAFGQPSGEQAPAPEPPQAQAGPADATADPQRVDEEPEAAPTPAPEETPAPPTIAAPAATLEERLGTRWAVWIGGLALALGGVLLVRYSIEQGIFGPGVRVALGALFALALVAAGEWFRRSERATPIGAVPAAHIPSILTAAGIISAFGTAYAAHALYQFIGPAAAFVMLGAIGIATMFAAALHGPALAGLGLAGSFIVPLLIESQQPNPWPLVIYLAVVAGAAYALARLRRWLWLAAATVAGAVIWGFALSGSVDLGGEGLWSAALFVHVAIQLALAAAFMAIEPHLAVPDDAAEPDWIAAAALAALTVLAVLALSAARMDAWWMTFAVAAMAILVATAWRSAPAAAAGPLAGVVALGAIAAWPGLKAPPEPSLLAPALEGVLRLPENVSQFLTFAALATLAVGAATVLRLWRGRTLPMRTAGLYALAAVVPPLLALVLAYLRVTQFDRSISFALFAVALAAIFYFVADRFDKTAGPDKTPATHLAIGAFASGVAAAMTLAFVMALDRGYLTVAFAVTALTTAIFATVDRIPLLRYVVVAIGFIVLGRLAWDPLIMGADVGTWPIFNWLLLGYGAPAVAFLAAGHILKREAEDLAVRICDALGVLFAALLVFFQIRHALNNGDPLAPISGHVEQGLFALTSLGFAAALIRMDLARGNPIFRAASLIFGVISGLVTLFGLGVIENPLISRDLVRGPVIFSSLLLAYLLPALAAIVLARTARGVRPQWYVTGAAVLALALLFGYVTLEVRHAFQGETLTIWQSTGAPEIWSYSVAWLGLGLAFLGYGLLRGSKEARLASAALVVLSVLKVFLYDLTGIGGFWRAFSVICLGGVLIGIGLVYQKLIFARPQAPPQS
jgi:uncharacterized membrane protein